MKKITLLAIVALSALPVFAQDINGSWFGVLNLGGRKLPVAINIHEINNAYTATMDSPAQGRKGIPVNTVNFSDDTLTFSIAGLRLEYKGVLAGDSIAGTFKQMGVALPLTFSKIAPDPRPQDPEAPYPYHAEEITFENKKAGIKLSGTLTWPKEGKRFPAVVLVSGSGPQNRNEEIFDHRPFLVLSDYLTRNGIAVLRYDDRGVGQSGGTYKTASLEDFTADAAAAVNYLMSRKEVDPKRTGMIGHSEGGTIAFLLAGQKNNKLSYIVSLAGMSIRGDSLLQMQRYLMAKAHGISDDKIAKNEALVTGINEVRNKYPADFIQAHIDSLALTLVPEELQDNKEAVAAVQQGLRQILSPELISLMQCDPSGALKAIRCPVLALNGEKDLQVPAEANLGRVQELVKSPVTVKEYPDLNHLFQPCDTGLPAEYGTIEETMSPEVMEDIAAWIKAQN